MNNTIKIISTFIGMILLLVIATILNVMVNSKCTGIYNRVMEINTEPVIIHDTLKITDTIIKYDTVLKYNNSTVYSNAIPSKLDTFETHKGNTKINVSFPDGDFNFDEVHWYKILCNGKFFTKNIDGEDYTECNGEWILTWEGER